MKKVKGAATRHPPGKRGGWSVDAAPRSAPCRTRASNDHCSAGCDGGSPPGISSSARLPPRDRMRCGWPTSRTSPPGAASCSSRLWSMPFRGERELACVHVDAHRSRLGCARAGALRPQDRRIARATLRPRIAILVDSIPERLSDAGIEPSVGRRGDADYQRARRDDRRPVQNASGSPRRTMALDRRCRIHRLGMGRLIQVHAAAGTAGRSTSRGVRSAVLPHRLGVRRAGAQISESPEKPGRFSVKMCS